MIVTILPETTKKPITLIGQRAAVCWNAKSNPEKDYKRGIDCIISGHGRVMEFVNVEFTIEGMSARAMRELYTHIAGGPTRLQASTRYIDYSSASYFTPKSLESSTVYKKAMEAAIDAYDALCEAGYPKEDVANLLPLGMNSKMVEKCNLRMLQNLMGQRLCSRAYSEMRDFAKTLRDALIKYGADSGADDGRNEWKEVAENLFVPKCKAVGFCTETRGSCGLMPSKDREWITEDEQR